MLLYGLLVARRRLRKEAHLEMPAKLEGYH